jgi:hypothetical protein
MDSSITSQGDVSGSSSGSVPPFSIDDVAKNIIEGGSAISLNEFQVSIGKITASSGNGLHKPAEGTLYYVVMVNVKNTSEKSALINPFFFSMVSDLNSEAKQPILEGYETDNMFRPALLQPDENVSKNLIFELPSNLYTLYLRFTTTNSAIPEYAFEIAVQGDE